MRADTDIHLPPLKTAAPARTVTRLAVAGSRPSAAREISCLLAGEEVRISDATAQSDCTIVDVGRDRGGLATLREALPGTPTVALVDDADTGYAALRAGAQDFVLRAGLTADGLMRAIRYAVDRVKVEAELEEARERLRCTFTEGPIGIVIFGVRCEDRGRIIEANAAFAQTIGRTPQEIEGLHLSSLTHPDDLGDQSAILAGLHDGSTQLQRSERRCRHADGSDVWFAITGAVVRNVSSEVTHGIAIFEDITERRRSAAALVDANHSLSFLAMHDLLTGLPNRAMLESKVITGLREVAVSGGLLGVFFMGLDRFKTVNESHGHETGDEILCVLAARLQSLMRDGDTLARFGSDEFVLVARVQDGEREAMGVAQRLVDALAEPIGTSAGSFSMAASVGVVLGEGAGCARDLMRDADTAMHEAKATGGGTYAVFEPRQRVRRMKELELEQDARRAIASDQLRVHFQPIVSLPDEQVTGFEALVRWEHPTRGLLAPDEFIAMAERTGLIVPLGRWVLREACRQVAAWTGGDAAPDWARVAVNVSPVQLADPDFLSDVQRVLADTGIDPERLAIEVTESALMDHSNLAVELFGEIKALGIQILLDDFGTGYSSLGYLTRFPIDGLKLDRGFVSGTDDVNRPIVEAVSGMAHSLGLTLTAEGVESQEQGELLASMGCDFAQGYLFARPMPGDRVASWMDTRSLELPAGARAPRLQGDLVSLGEAAAALSVSSSTVRRWADEGRLPSVRTDGGHRRFSLTDLKRLATATPGTVKPRMGLPLAGPIPVLADVIENDMTDLLDTTAKVVYEGRALGWYAQERSLRARVEWARRIGRAARTGDHCRAVEATTALLRQSELGGGSLLETSLFVERFAAVAVTRLPQEIEPADRAGIQRMFAGLRRQLLVGR